MGTLTSSPQSLLNQYTFEKKPSNGNHSILKHKKTGEILLLKQISTTSQSDLNLLLEKSYKRKGLNHQHYLTLQQVFQKAEGSFCSTLYKANLLYQYGNHTLQHQIETRVQQHRQFQQKQLWSIICSTVLALNFLLKQNIQYPFISPSDIFLNNEGIVKIPDPEVTTQTFSGGFSMKSTNYLSPQSMQGRQNPAKSCIFSLGICLLQTMLMQSMAVCYNYQDYKLDQKQLSYKIQQVKSKGYNVSLISIVEDMLIVDPKKRPSISQLEQKLFSILRQDQTHQFQGSTAFSSSGSVDQIQGDQNIQNQVNSQKLSPMIPEREEFVSLVVQVFEEIDYQNPDDAQQQSEGILTDRSNRILPNNLNQTSKHQYSNQKKPKQQTQNIQPYPSNRKYDQDIFTDPQLLQMLRKDIHEINMKKSKYLNYSCSNDVSTKIENPSVQYSLSQKKQKIVPENKKASESFLVEADLKYVNENYARGRYQGQKKGNLREGYGTFFYKEGGRYTGSWKNNKMHGKGTLFYANNQTAYEGDWIQDHLWGFGTLYNQDPQPLKGGYGYKSFDQVDEYWIKYQGQFVDDNKCGSGKLFLSNGQIFQGLFQNDAVHGRGTFITFDGKRIEGEWKQNRLVKQQR